MSSTASTNNSLVKNKVFVGGIPHGTTSDELNRYFSNFGKIKRIDLPVHKKSGRGKGFAFVEFKTVKSVELVLETENHSLNEKLIAVRKAMETEKASSHTKNLQKRKLYVKGFDLNQGELVTEDNVAQIFKQFGQVDRVLIARNSKTGMFRGFVYVIMSTLEDVQNVLKNKSNLVFEQNLLEVEISKTLHEVHSNRKVEQVEKNSQKRSFFRESEPSQQSDSDSQFSVSFDIEAHNKMRLGLSRGMMSQPLSKRMISKKNNSKKNKSGRKYDIQRRTRSQRILEEEDDLVSNNCNNNGRHGTRNSSNRGWNRPLNHRNQPRRRSRFGQEPENSMNHVNNRRSIFRNRISPPSSFYSDDFSIDSLAHQQNSYPQNQDFQNFGTAHNSSNSENLSGQDLVRRHHLIWRNTNSGSNTENTQMNLNFIAPSFAQASEHTPLGYQRQSLNTSEANIASYYQGNRDAVNGVYNNNNPSLLTNNLQNGRGPVQTQWRNGETEGQEDNGPTVEIKQTIKTEYRIKQDGIVYTGAINETNIWGSHLHPEY